MKPLWPVVRSVTFVVKPAAGSLICTLSTSPGFMASVWALGVRVCALVFCGLGGPAGTPLRFRKVELNGSVVLGVRLAKFNCDSKLLLFIASHPLGHRQVRAFHDRAIP